MNSQKIIHAALFFSFFLCYLEWGTDQSGFIFQLEYNFFSGGKDVMNSFSHPLVLLPFLGQLLLLFTAVQKRPNKRLGLIGLLCILPLVLMIILAGALSLNYKMVASTIPFITACIFFFRTYRRKEKASV